jgi:hypothetical protein
MFKKLFLFVSFFNNPIFILIIFNLANLLNLCFQIIASRNLNFLEFSLFFSFISITNIILGPFASVQLYIQQSLYNKKKDVKINFDEFIPFCLRIFTILQIIILLVYLILLEVIKNKTNYYSNDFYFLIFIYFSLSMFMIIPGGILYSERKYKSVHLIILAIDLIRVLLFFLFIEHFQNKLEFMISLNIIYTFFCILLMLIKMDFQFLKSLKIAFDFSNFFLKTKKFFLTFLKFVFYSACLPLITQLDIIFVKFLFSNEISSSYIVISTLGKVIFIIPLVLQGYLFNESYFVKKKQMFYNYIFVLVLSLVIFLVSLIIIEFLVNLLYGSKYLLSIDAFSLIAVSFLLISISNLMMNNLLVNKKFTFLFTFYFAIILYIGLNFLNNASYFSVAQNLLISSLVLFFGVIANFYYSLIKNEK